jgi:hypothetical protein
VAQGPFGPADPAATEAHAVKTAKPEKRTYDAPKRVSRRKLIPVVSDLESLSRCASRTLCEMARGSSPHLWSFTLADLRTTLETEFVELEEALEELDLLIVEQGSDTKAVLLDLEPVAVFDKIRAQCLTKAKGSHDRDKAL